MSRSVRTARELGAVIVDARHHHGLTQQQLAEKARVSRSWLIGVEQGQRKGAELNKILGLLRTLGVSLSLELPPEDGSDAEASAQDAATVFGPEVTEAFKDYVREWAAPSKITVELERRRQERLAQGAGPSPHIAGSASTPQEG